ncbi:MAG: winged helix-turn-helix transcriptional regulator [Candidatus Methanoperedens sp.]|nr:winged helix-turn-helix transcriptional regulator [Candidatus Methanoperedens sp.]MCE8429481.1 winged helix-turn-helix transcriptional regulator [Candidatus Methanoperedens sp.]
MNCSYTRGFILNKLADKPYNVNQLAEALNIDYQTTSHHLDVLANNGIITIESDEYCRIYLLYKDMEADMWTKKPDKLITRKQNEGEQ